jgi:hypothetical protein
MYLLTTPNFLFLFSIYPHPPPTHTHLHTFLCELCFLTPTPIPPHIASNTSRVIALRSLASSASSSRRTASPSNVDSDSDEALFDDDEESDGDFEGNNEEEVRPLLEVIGESLKSL